MQVQTNGALETLLPSRVMSVVRHLFGCFSGRDEIYRQAHSFSFDSAKQQHVIDTDPVGKGSIRRRSSHGKTPLRVRFNVPTNEAFKGTNLHAALRDLLVYVIREGLRVSDLFRRPGNSSDMKLIVKQLADGTTVDWSGYNFYTVANTAKKFLLNIPGGIFGVERERGILETFDLDDATRIRTVGAHLQTLPTGARQFLVLLFGAWYLLVFGGGSQSEAATRAPCAVQLEAVSKSVCGSLFHTCDDPRKVERAVHVMGTMIAQFVNPTQHGAEMLDYFARATGIDVRRPTSDPLNGAPQRVSRQPSRRVTEPLHTASTPDFSVHTDATATADGIPLRASRFNSVRRRQLERLRDRSAWFSQTHAPTVSLSAVFHERWRAAVNDVDLQPALLTAHSGPEMDTASVLSPLQMHPPQDILCTPASEPLQRARLGSQLELSGRKKEARERDGAKSKPRQHVTDEHEEPSFVADEPSSTMTVERFDFELPSDQGEEDEQWSANTVL